MNDIVRLNDDPADRFEQDLEVCDELCKGTDRRQVAKDKHLSLAEVEKSLIRVTGGVSPAIRERHLLMIVRRNEKIQSVYYKKAIDEKTGGDTEAANVCLKANNFTAQLLGLFPPPMTQHAMENRPQESTTEQIQAAIDRIRGKTDRTIDGEATEVKDD